ncbi:hypothetical protein H7F15_16100 [Pontibacter sp. Tf4]|uniref:hypothetical protein n=1 Tax=Pontibacter sp. Tf4 TaxID=2761620 RepID=UPI001623482A|nr:hypothetical protein [Pontibacter sp. Tf4]MBB6612567.1 hypothetical protein [Pontibacter sp. Tf4]
MIFACARCWQIEQAFRFNKSEMGMESCRLWFWENRMKPLQIVMLVYAFLLDKALEKQKERLLRLGAHRTGKRCGNTPAPLYRIRLALAKLWKLPFLSIRQTPG